jgi:hypothetical protein
MITIETARKNLVKIVLLLALVIFLVAFGVDMLLQKRTEIVTTESTVTNSWLRGEMSEINDPEINKIWSNIGEKLMSYDSYFQNPGKVASGQPLVKSDDFPKNNAANTETNSQWLLNPKEPPIETNFKFALTIAPKDPAPTADELTEDKDRYEKIMGAIISSFTKNQTKNLTPEGYTERMLDFFDVEDIVKRKMPGLGVQWIYVASTRGTFAIYPSSDQTFRGFDPRSRPWYKSALTPSIPDTPPSEHLVSGEPAAFGLVSFYPDFVGKNFMRTFWHRITVNGVDYLICVDLVLTPKDLRYRNDFFDNIPPVKNSSIGGGGYTRAAKVGVMSGVTFLALGLAFTLLGGKWSNGLARRIITADISSKESETGDRFRPFFRALAARDTSRSIHSDTTVGASAIRKTSLSALIVMNVSELRHEEQRIRQKTSSRTVTEAMRLDTLDNDIHTRGIEKWDIYRRKGQWVGRCRLCSQEVLYQDKEVRIGEANIKHGVDSKPDVSLNIDTHWHSTDSPTIKDSVIWQVLDTKTRHLGNDYELKPYPPPRVPDEVQSHSFAREILENYRLLSEGRYETADAVELSKELFRNRDVRSACTIPYLQHLIESGDTEAGVLRVGNDIERILIGDSQEVLAAFIEQHRGFLASLLTQRKNLHLYTVSLDKMRIGPIETYPELDFAIAHGAEDFKYLVITHPDERGRGGNMRGYVSWREVDISFCETLFERLKDFKQSLKLDDLKISPAG